MRLSLHRALSRGGPHFFPRCRLPVLANARHEAFARELAAGNAAPEAFAAAGYQPNQAAALRLAGQVKARVDEIRAEANQTVAKRLAITQERILKEYAR